MISSKELSQAHIEVESNQDKDPSAGSILEIVRNYKLLLLRCESSILNTFFVTKSKQFCYFLIGGAAEDLQLMICTFLWDILNILDSILY